MAVEIEDILYANFNVSALWSHTQAEQTDFTNLPDKSADKIIICLSSIEDIKRYEKYLTDDLYIELNDGRLGLIMHKSATKQSAIKIIADRMGLGFNDIVAFGDDYNDIGMLRECGTGVAVINALDEVKAAADCVCDSNDNDGVAKWIGENIL